MPVACGWSSGADAVELRERNWTPDRGSWRPRRRRAEALGLALLTIALSKSLETAVTAGGLVELRAQAPLLAALDLVSSKGDAHRHWSDQSAGQQFSGFLSRLRESDLGFFLQHQRIGVYSPPFEPYVEPSL